MGAAEVIDTSTNATWDEVVLELTHGLGVDHVLDVIGGDSNFRVDRSEFTATIAYLKAMI
ncbi:hypothetical protein [Tunturiibacter gelidoferens]|uniref:NADPH:quinone reductase-like Zn-dependent oxidoreductase n=1 Tax=Tunturiibacter gelidiferens TaxID=3069689 RepID=A0A9X0QIS4_9BACT|nr:hypothetical protein [Edaphobacter lichenicola]MBB5331136.1 NADPH:quinone reductase-like Zn-dependent oxidoreductase [Edaphobacter lichenicola]